MDLNDIRALFTLVSFAIFLGLAWHTWHRRRQSDHAEAAQLIFQGEALTESPEAVRPQKEANHG